MLRVRSWFARPVIVRVGALLMLIGMFLPQAAPASFGAPAYTGWMWIDGYSFTALLTLERRLPIHIDVLSLLFFVLLLLLLLIAALLGLLISRRGVSALPARIILGTGAVAGIHFVLSALPFMEAGDPPGPDYGAVVLVLGSLLLLVGEVRRWRKPKEEEG